MPPNPARTINLLKGYPSPSLLPAPLLGAASQRILSDPTTSTPALLYGADEGYWPLRISIARWLDGFYGGARRIYASQQASTVDTDLDRDIETAAGRITITGGASQSLGVMLSTFTDPAYTQTVWMVVPTYFLAFKILQDAGFAGRLRPVPEDEEGIDVDFLEAELANAEQHLASQPESHWRGYKPASLFEKVYRHVIYVVPTFANPSSRTMSLKRRERLVQTARRYDALIVCDDVYDMLQWPRNKDETSVDANKAQLPRVLDIDRHLEPAPGDAAFGNAVSNGSFSKILGPGIRTGWVEATPKFAFRLSQTGAQKSGGAPSQYAAVCVNELLRAGQLQRHVRDTLRSAYERRWRLMREAITNELEPLGVSVIEQTPGQEGSGLAGGYFIWVTLPEPLRGHEVAERAKDQRLMVGYGEMFEVPPPPEEEEIQSSHADCRGRSTLPIRTSCEDRFPRSLRLCYSFEDEALLKGSVKALAQVIRSFRQNIQ